ncbi:MAG: hypothetical protein RDV41_00430 [Planctomycetota bacterium]|nr:hypothetical protein [Planctomycetota bacterium]
MTEAAPELEALIAKFVEARGADPAPVETRPELSKMITELDSRYWKEVEAVVTVVMREGGERLVFNKYQRFMLDCGLLDERLLGPTPGDVKNILLKEIYGEGRPNHFYFSQWLADRFRNFVVFNKFEGAQAAGEASPFVPDENLLSLRAARVKVYTALRPFFENLPGFTKQVVELLCSGKLDANAEGMTVESLRKPDDDALAEQRNKLVSIRRQLLAKAKTRSVTEKQLMLFDALDQVDLKVATALSQHAAPAQQPVRKPSEEDGDKHKIMSFRQRLEFVQTELKLVRSLLRLGVTGSGISRTHSVLLSTQKRMSKQDVQTLLGKIMEVDPNIPGQPNILIAPFMGTGFFEWDRDTIFIPLISTRTEEESIVNALANYRIMIDNLHSQGNLKRAYETRFKESDFRNAFLRDYKSWIVGVGKGFRGALDPDRYKFFKEYIGPSPDKLFAPFELVNISPNEHQEMIKNIRSRINRSEAVFDDYYKLAVLYHKERRPAEALDQMAVGVKLDPTDGRAMFSLGYLCLKLGIWDKARKALEEVENIAPNSLWQVYAADLLQKVP